MASVRSLRPWRWLERFRSRCPTSTGDDGALAREVDSADDVGGGARAVTGVVIRSCRARSGGPGGGNAAIDVQGGAVDHRRFIGLQECDSGRDVHGLTQDTSWCEDDGPMPRPDVAVDTTRPVLSALVIGRDLVAATSCRRERSWRAPLRLRW